MSKRCERDAKGALRIWEIVAPYGLLQISKSSFYAGIKSGRFPAPIKLGPKTSVWKTSSILALIEKGSTDGK